MTREEAATIIDQMPSDTLLSAALAALAELAAHDQAQAQADHQAQAQDSQP